MPIIPPPQGIGEIKREEPLLVSVTALTKTTIELDWLAPNTEGPAITGYQIERSENLGAFGIIVSDTGNTDLTFTDSDGALITGNFYTYRIAAIRGVLTGVSNELGTLLAILPTAPVSLVASVVPTFGEIDLTWQVPADDGGSPITDYIVQFKLTVDSTFTIFSDGVSTNLFATVTGLVPGELYDFRVLAVTAKGEGPPSNIETIITADVPDAPTALTATVQSLDIFVQWLLPINTGELPLTNIKLQRNENGGAFSDLITLGPTITSHLDISPTKGITFGYRSIAINALGESIPSNEATAIIPVPLTPNLLAVVLGGLTITPFTVDTGKLPTPVTDTPLRLAVTTTLTAQPNETFVVKFNGNIIPHVLESSPGDGDIVLTYNTLSDPIQDGDIIELIHNDPLATNTENPNGVFPITEFGARYGFTEADYDLAGSADSTANNNTATPLGSGLEVRVAGINGFGFGVEFNPTGAGSDDAGFTISDDLSIRITNQSRIAIWVKDPNGGTALLRKDATVASAQPFSYQNTIKGSGEPRGRQRTTVTFNSDGTTIIPGTTWHKIVWTWINDSYDCKVDDTLEGSVAQLNSTPLADSTGIDLDIAFPNSVDHTGTMAHLQVGKHVFTDIEETAMFDSESAPDTFYSQGTSQLQPGSTPQLLTKSGLEILAVVPV